MRRGVADVGELGAVGSGGGAAGLPPLSPGLVGVLDLPVDVPELLSIAQVAELTELSAHTLRYWERIGLLRVGRNSARRRVYDRDALGQVAFIARLRASDMSIATIRHYVDLVRAGDHTVPQRLALMGAHRAEIRRRLHELRSALSVIDYKIASYGGPDAS